LFRDKWLEAVEEKNSVLCAGLDPAVYEMGRGPKGLPEGVDKREWSLDYVRKVAPYSAALKPNIQYWKGEGDAEALKEIIKEAHDLGMVVIEDSKLADIGSTNDAGFFYASKRNVDAITFSPFAGNIKEAAEQGHKRGIGVISMVLMSNPDYRREKNKLVNVSEEVEEYFKADIKWLEKNDGITPWVPQYIQLAHDAKKYGIDGIVIGAPSKKNHITNEEIEAVRRYVGDDMLVLLPGVGHQGGEADVIWKYFDKDNVIVNVGRAMMFPKEGTPETTAKYYRDMLNELRGV